VLKLPSERLHDYERSIFGGNLTPWMQ